MSALTQAGAQPTGSRPVDRSERGMDRSHWGTLYWVGGAAALLLALIMLGQIGVFMIAPPQSSAADWFALFQSSPLKGLLGFELLMIVYVILSIPLALALTAALYHASPSWMAIYLALSLVGGVLFVVARPAFEMLNLSQHYAAAATGAQRAAILAAGEAAAAAFDGTAFQVSYVLGSLGGLILSAVMLKSRLFGKTAAYLRIASSVLDLGLFIPVIGLYISIFSVLFLWVFNILVGWRLLRLGRGEENPLTQPL